MVSRSAAAAFSWPRPASSALAAASRRRKPVKKATYSEAHCSLRCQREQRSQRKACLSCCACKKLAQPACASSVAKFSEAAPPPPTAATSLTFAVAMDDARYEMPSPRPRRRSDRPAVLVCGVRVFHCWAWSIPLCRQRGRCTVSAGSTSGEEQRTLTRRWRRARRRAKSARQCT